jgi:hypothetical protein
LVCHHNAVAVVILEVSELSEPKSEPMHLGDRGKPIGRPRKTHREARPIHQATGCPGRQPALPRL